MLTLEEERLINAWQSGGLGGSPEATRLARIAGRLQEQLRQAEARCAEMGKLIEYCQLVFETLAPYREEGQIAFSADEWAKRVLKDNPGQPLLDRLCKVEAERDAWRREMAKVTGLGVDATVKETADLYAENVNAYVVMKAERDAAIKEGEQVHATNLRLLAERDALGAWVLTPSHAGFLLLVIGDKEDCHQCGGEDPDCVSCAEHGVLKTKLEAALKGGSHG